MGRGMGTGKQNTENIKLMVTSLISPIGLITQVVNYFYHEYTDSIHVTVPQTTSEILGDHVIGCVKFFM